MNSSTSKFPVEVAVVGATGLVGIEMLKILNEPEYKGRYKPVLFASTARPEQGVLELKANVKQLQKCAYVLNGATSEVAEFLAENLVPGQVLIDNSSRYRMDPGVPLVVPEINGDLLKSAPSIVANPNCTAILLCLTLAPFKEAGLARVVVSTYQAASGAGIKALEELEAQLKALGRGEPLPRPEVFPFVLAGNVISHNTPVRADDVAGAGYNEEEWKVIEETRKILNIRHLPISASCMRVPVRRAHTETVTVDLKEELPLSEFTRLMSQAKGVTVVNEPTKNHFPMPLEAENENLVRVGRMRKDASLGKTYHYMLAGDQIRKGAALNAIQIMAECEAIK